MATKTILQPTPAAKLTSVPPAVGPGGGTDGGKITPTQKSITVHATKTSDVAVINEFPPAKGDELPLAGSEASLTPPPSREDRQEEAAWLLEKEARYRREKAWREAELEDLLEARLDEEFWSRGC